MGIHIKVTWIVLLFVCSKGVCQDPQFQYELELGTDNDKFIVYTATDRNYTYGLHAAFRWRTQRKSLINRLFQKAKANYLGIGLNIKAYTPEYLDEGISAETERPFAGWSYLRFQSTYVFQKSFFRLGLDIGILGPDSQAGQIQNWFHKNISNDAAVDWNGQIPNQIGINATGIYTFTLYRWRWVDTYALTEISLGNIFTYMLPHLNFRVGQFNPIGESIATHNGILSHTGKTEFFLEYGLGLKLSAFDATVQGNILEDDIFGTNRINHTVFTMHLGLHLAFGHLAVLARYYYKTGEFENVKVHRYGAIKLFYRFN